MVNCNFCDKEIEPGCGKLFIKKDGRTHNFCASKCEKNMLLLKRKPRTTKWTGEYEKEKAIQKSVDSTSAQKKKKTTKAKKK
ncbi:50S ribosomal protein L24e [Candidatus Woesearchaeota archaeon]|nr:50S ribosomal protein L24e [Candidatus Woesearchaeota archaeon]